MNTQKIQLKYFAAKPEALSLEAVVPVFHEWIREKKIGGDELLFDVADYAHVPKGPGVALIGHESDYFVDEGEGRPGLLYSRKRGFEGDADACLRDAFTRALTACSLLEKDPSVEVEFATGELLFRIQDRLNAPNSAETFAKVKPQLEAVLGTLYPNASAAIEHVDEPRAPFTLRVKVASTDSVDTLLERL